jgi:hypothetical protein
MISWGDINHLLDIITNKKVIAAGMFLLGVIVTSVFGEFFKYIYIELKNRIFERRMEFICEWIPSNPVNNKNTNINKIDEYPKDLMFDFNKGDFILENGDFPLIQGYDCFIMHLTKLINTEKDKYEIYSSNYGITYKYHNIYDEQEFSIISIANASDIITVFDEWIREIYFIKKYKDKELLQIGFGLKGRNEIVKIDIPLVQRSTSQ